MIRHLMAVTATVAFGGISYPAVVDPCEIKTCEAIDAAGVAYDADVDGDVFTLYNMAEGICETAHGLDEDGLSANDIIDSAVDVFTEQGLVTTTEGVFYLRGVLRGCLAG